MRRKFCDIIELALAHQKKGVRGIYNRRVWDEQLSWRNGGDHLKDCASVVKWSLPAKSKRTVA
jgi:hypothetical protein